jgi:GR25 family glycosyltransferase involved in LPS biosynthesis
MLYAIGVVAHTARDNTAHTLAHKVNAAHLSIDDGALGCDRNHLRVWQALTDHDATWSVVLEDDAQPIDDFHYQLEHALLNAPTPVVSLYLGKAYPVWWQPRIQVAIEHAQAERASFIVAKHLLHCVGVAIKTPLVPYVVRTPQQPHAWPIDEHIGMVAQRHFQQPAIAYTWPSLVDHEDGPTLQQHNDGLPRTPGRKAWLTGTREQWDSSTVHMGPH